MSKKNYEPCPNCDEKKVTLLGDDEYQGVKMRLHNVHVIHAPYEEYKIWVCLNCGWVASTRWHKQNYSNFFYDAILAELEPNVVEKSEPIEVDWSEPGEFDEQDI